MQWTVKDSNDSINEIRAAKYPKMRLFTVPRVFSLYPFSDVNGSWKEVTSFSVGEFSGVGYFFGKELHERLNKPVGLIDTSYGGTKIELWMSEDALETWKGFAELKNTGSKPKDSPLELHRDGKNEGLILAGC
jgi:sialate O-acetylesterase